MIRKAGERFNPHGTWYDRHDETSGATWELLEDADDSAYNVPAQAVCVAIGGRFETHSSYPWCVGDTDVMWVDEDMFEPRPSFGRLAP